MPLVPGSRLGPYEILTPIGAGGMGEVWKARDTRLDRIVAIKHPRAQSGRFEQEARAIVTNVLEGSVRRAGNRIRVTAQLIAGELKLKFAPAEHPRHLPNLQAYEAYLRYRQYQWGFTPEAFARSRECLEQAIALEPNFALPYVGLADHYFASMTFGNAGELVPRARQLAGRAPELDPGLAEAHAMLGILAGFCDRNSRLAAIPEEPELAGSIIRYAKRFYPKTARGRPRDSNQELHHARRPPAPQRGAPLSAHQGAPCRDGSSRVGREQRRSQ